MEKKLPQTAAGKQRPKQENKQIWKDATGSQCVGKCVDDKATSNAK